MLTSDKLWTPSIGHLAKLSDPAGRRPLELPQSWHPRRGGWIREPRRGRPTSPERGSEFWPKAAPQGSHLNENGCFRLQMWRGRRSASRKQLCTFQPKALNDTPAPDFNRVDLIRGPVPNSDKTDESSGAQRGAVRRNAKQTRERRRPMLRRRRPHAPAPAEGRGDAAGDQWDEEAADIAGRVPWGRKTRRHRGATQQIPCGRRFALTQVALGVPCASAISRHARDRGNLGVVRWSRDAKHDSMLCLWSRSCAASCQGISMAIEASTSLHRAVPASLPSSCAFDSARVPSAVRLPQGSLATMRIATSGPPQTTPSQA